MAAASNNHNQVPVPDVPDGLAVRIVSDRGKRSGLVPVQQSDALTTTTRGLGTFKEIERRVCQ